MFTTSLELWDSFRYASCALRLPSQGAGSPQLWPNPCPLSASVDAPASPPSFAGLTQRPHCAACEGDAAHPTPLPPRRPAPMLATTDAPVSSTPPCIPALMHAVITEAGWDSATCAPMAILAAVHGGSCSVRPVTATFWKRTAPIFHGNQASVELIVRVLACLAEGLGIRATARVFEVDPNTVLCTGWSYLFNNPWHG